MVTAEAPCSAQGEAVVELSSNQRLDHDESADALYPSGPKLFVIIFGLCLAVFCVALDSNYTPALTSV